MYTDDSVVGRIDGVRGITPAEKAVIEDELIERARAWTAAHGKAPFKTVNIVGGENADWSESALDLLYRRRKENPAYTEAQAQRAAGWDAGRIMKSALKRAPELYRTMPVYGRVYEQA